MIITIGRECGCDGDEVAARLASKYGIACYTKKDTGYVPDRGAADRTRHEPGDEHLRGYLRAELRAHHRQGHTGEHPGGPGGH